MAATDNAVEPWISGEFDITSLLRGAPRILNRAQFIDHADRQLQLAKKSIETRFALLLASLDNHHEILTEKGKKAAELLIRAMIEPLGPMLARHDSIAIFPNGTVAILLETARLRGTATDFATEMVGGLKGAAQDCGVKEPTFSVGIAKVTGGYISSEDILRDAGIALHVAETEGRDQIMTFHRGMEETPSQSSIAI